MYEYLVREQIAILVKKGIIDSTKEDESVKTLMDEYWSSKIAVTWSVDDVTSRAKEMGVLVDDDEAAEMLQDIFQDHDCNYGITWDGISDRIGNIVNDEFNELTGTKIKDLPTLIGKFKAKKVQIMLDKRIRGSDDWKEWPNLTEEDE